MTFQAVKNGNDTAANYIIIFILHLIIKVRLDQEVGVWHHLQTKHQDIMDRNSILPSCHMINQNNRKQNHFLLHAEHINKHRYVITVVAV